MFPPDKMLYPDYDEYLEKSMIAETVGFFREVLKRNASLREFLDSDWTMLNERLADALRHRRRARRGDAARRAQARGSSRRPAHAGGDPQPHLRRHAASPGASRRVGAGVDLRQAAAAAAGQRARARTRRPPNAPKTTLREKLEPHRADANCAACHARSTRSASPSTTTTPSAAGAPSRRCSDGAGADPELDPSGELPDGRKFADAGELKQLLLADIDKFAAAFTEKLATYALRRGMTFADRDD